MIKIEYIFCPAVGLYVSLYRASMDSGHTSNHAVEHTHTHLLALSFLASAALPGLVTNSLRRQDARKPAVLVKVNHEFPHGAARDVHALVPQRRGLVLRTVRLGPAAHRHLHQHASNCREPTFPPPTRRKLPQAALQGGKANVPRRYDALGIDDPLPRDVGVVEAVRRIARQVLHAHAHLSGPLCCHPPLDPSCQS